jgi:7-carboxy-7-deazaguanine synthase
MATVNICETFVSIQGETTYAGLSCFFIRLAGCNLRCRYCDTTYAYNPGLDAPIQDLVEECRRNPTAIVEITGGEPLLQAGFRELAAALRDRGGRPVLVETNGSLDISAVPAGVIAIMDVKCPGSGVSEAMDPANIGRLRPQDEVKFVLSDRKDYEWARDFVKRHTLATRCHAVLFSPVFGKLPAKEVGQWILEDGSPVRVQVQLHKVLGMK